MIVKCENCQAKFKLADDKIGPKGAKLKCKKCGNVFVVRPPSKEDQAADASAGQSQAFEGGNLSSAIKDALSGMTDESLKAISSDAATAAENGGQDTLPPEWKNYGSSGLDEETFKPDADLGLGSRDDLFGSGEDLDKRDAPSQSGDKPDRSMFASGIDDKGHAVGDFSNHPESDSGPAEFSFPGSAPSANLDSAPEPSADFNPDSPFGDSQDLSPPPPAVSLDSLSSAAETPPADASPAADLGSHDDVNPFADDAPSTDPFGDAAANQQQDDNPFDMNGDFSFADEDNAAPAPAPGDDPFGSNVADDNPFAANGFDSGDSAEAPSAAGDNPFATDEMSSPPADFAASDNDGASADNPFATDGFNLEDSTANEFKADPAPPAGDDFFGSLDSPPAGEGTVEEWGNTGDSEAGSFGSWEDPDAGKGRDDMFDLGGGSSAPVGDDETGGDDSSHSYTSDPDVRNELFGSEDGLDDMASETWGDTAAPTQAKAPPSTPPPAEEPAALAKIALVKATPEEIAAAQAELNRDNSAGPVSFTPGAGGGIKRAGKTVTAIKKIFAAIGILLILVGSSYLAFYIYKHPELTAKLKLDQLFEKILGPAKPAQEKAFDILVETTRGYPIQNIEGVEYFVIEGTAKNTSSDSQSFIRLRGILLNAEGLELSMKNAYAGNVLSEDQLRSFSRDNISEHQNTEIGDGLINLNIAPGNTVPFQIVFFSKPVNAVEYKAEVVSVKVGTE